ncbi:hypothetical protein HK405_012853, partial [Cladochytrium tenue]
MTPTPSSLSPSHTTPPPTGAGTTANATLNTDADAFVFVTLVTSDAYLPGAVTLAHSLRAAGSRHPAVVLVTPTALSRHSLAALYRAFDRVVNVPALRSGAAPGDREALHALGRPDLDVSLTKLHAWNPDVLGQGVRAFAFLDADAFVLPGRSADPLLRVLDDSAADFAAAPDVGWPDAFNSGVFVARPRRDVFDALLRFAATTGSFDGGDQGLLNTFFHGWAVGTPAVPPGSPELGPLRAVRIPFTFNVTPSAVYSYLPAFNRFRSDINIVHFAGTTKPWNLRRFADGTVMHPNLSSEAVSMHNLWWAVHEEYLAKIKAEDELELAEK